MNKVAIIIIILAVAVALVYFMAGGRLGDIKVTSPETTETDNGEIINPTEPDQVLQAETETNLDENSDMKALDSELEKIDVSGGELDDLDKALDVE